MQGLLQLEPWWRFVVALLIGMLIGLEREFIKQQDHNRSFAGIRTYGLISLMGALAAYLVDPHGIEIMRAVLLGLIALVTIGYAASVLIRKRETGITTEVSVLLAFLLGAMVVWDQAELAAGLAVIVALVLAVKTPLHRVVSRMTTEDLHATLQFALVSLVVLPLLPNRTVDPFGVLNPFQIWLLVVFISGIGFAGYILMKMLGANQGIGLTGLIGGIVSSTATTLSLATHSKDSPDLAPQLAEGITLATVVMLPRVVIAAGVVYPAVIRGLLIPLGLMVLTGVLAVYLLRRRYNGDTPDAREIEVANPLRLTTAITFGALFTLMLLIVRVAATFGATGVYIASGLTGLTDVDAITLSTANLARGGSIALPVAVGSIVLASITNTLTKIGIASVTGTPALRRLLFAILGSMSAAGAVSGFLIVQYGASMGVW